MQGSSICVWGLGLCVSTKMIRETAVGCNLWGLGCRMWGLGMCEYTKLTREAVVGCRV